MAKLKQARIASRQPRLNKQPETKPNGQVKRLILAAFCLSGFAGLMHQVVWAKLLAGLIGTTAHAQAVVLAVFMAGLAIGSVLFGRRVDQRGSPLRTYVALEILIALYCLLLPMLLWVAEAGYVYLAGYFFESTTFTFSLRFCLALLLVLVPAVLMGGTLPVLCRQLVVGVHQTQKYVASLYAFNSFGAVLGAATAGFLSLPLLGVYASLVIASLLNLVAAALLLSPARREPPGASATELRALEKKFTRTALILVGPVLGTDEFRDSYLYDESKAHVYRPQGKSAKRKTVDSPIAHPTLKERAWLPVAATAQVAADGCLAMALPSAPLRSATILRRRTPGRI